MEQIAEAIKHLSTVVAISGAGLTLIVAIVGNEIAKAIREKKQ